MVHTLLSNSIEKYLAKCETILTGFRTQEFASTFSENLISPWNLHLSKSSLEKIESFVEATFLLRSSPSYQASLEDEMQRRHLKPVNHSSLFMSYDFHLRSNGDPALIEVNTNASFWGLGFPLYLSRSLPHLSGAEPWLTLKADIENEVGLVKNTGKDLKVSICDSNPKEQRLFSEFLFFQQLFQSWGWDCRIEDVQNLSMDRDWIYNRSTDFYLETEETRLLRKIYETGNTYIAPGPNEYLLLADKARLQEWSNIENFQKWKLPELAPRIHKGLLKSETLTRENADELWARRKHLFFKPMRSFGSKLSYKGASISRKLFEELHNHEMIAQEYLAAPEVTLKGSEETGPFKFDLRIYVYRDKVRGALARLYQGQVTNNRTPLGGFAPIQWMDDEVAPFTELGSYPI